MTQKVVVSGSEFRLDARALGADCHCTPGPSQFRGQGRLMTRTDASLGLWCRMIMRRVEFWNQVVD